jgi:lycopene cyclase domain-containing protein
MSFYLWVLAATITGPLLLSFDKKVHFYTRWQTLFPATLVVAMIFIAWDAYFTHEQVWGFTPRYLTGIYWGNLPIEECLFFLVVPYACLFIYEVIRAWFPHRRTAVMARLFAFTMVFSGLMLAAVYLDNWYTATACLGASLLIIGLYFVARVRWFGDFALMYLVVLVPFLAVDGILTGMATGEPVVWYDEEQITGFRIGAIPLEDLYYNVCLLLPVTAIYEWLNHRSRY